jgi:hypothetical protein
MSAVSGALTALALFLPLAGALALWLLPSNAVLMRFRRRAAALILGVTTLLLLVSRLAGTSATFPFWQPLFAVGATIEFAADPLGSGVALLCSLAVTIVCLATLARPLERHEAAGMLWLVGATAGVTLAANLLTLCLAWLLLSLGLFFADLLRAPEEGVPHIVRNSWSGLLSSATLVAATVALLNRPGGGGRLVDVFVDGLPQRYLMAAALLRLGIYPLPGSLRRNWLAYMASLAAGAYLWLRLVALAPGALPWQGWLVPLGAGTLLASGLLAVLLPDLALALPALLLNGLTLVVLAPLIDRSAGMGVGLAAAAGLLLSLAVLRADSQVRPFGALGRWARAPLVLALGALVGWPGTVGFTTHWLFLRLCAQGGRRDLLLIAAVSFLLITVPVWPRLRYLAREVCHATVPSPGQAWLSVTMAMLGAVLLVTLGLTPTLGGLLWPDAPASARELVAPSVVTMFSGGLVEFTTLVLVAIVFPAMGSYALQGLWDSLPLRITRWGDVLCTFLELDWLYAGLDRLFERIGRVLARTLVAVEEGLYLGWTLLWVLVVALYLIGH